MNGASQKHLLLKVLNNEHVERPPVWLMRQAGRILPQYRKIRSSLSGFIELVQTPSLAAEVTIQPVDELGVDAAIIFSDILVIPEAMGLEYELIEKKGPFFPTTIESASDVSRLSEGIKAAEKLHYVFEALEITKRELNDRVPLIGFSGAPWTLMSYMIEGQGSKTFSKAKKFLYQEEKAAHELLQKLTHTIIAYLKLKIEHGADVVQVFDSWAGILDRGLYAKFCLPYLKQIVDEIDTAPVIIFCRGAWYSLQEIIDLGSAGVGLDWNTPAHAARLISETAVFQGNMDPCQLYASPDEIEVQAKAIIKEMGKGHIMNLGHGVYPDTPLENVKHFVNTVKAYKY
jgi:uroporphyrinogen decarboxylase